MLGWFHLLQKDSSIENVIPYRITLPYAWFLLLFLKNQTIGKTKIKTNRKEDGEVTLFYVCCC